MTLKPGLGVTVGHRNYTIRSGTHDFLLTFHSSHQLSRTVSKINGDGRKSFKIGSAVLIQYRIYRISIEFYRILACALRRLRLRPIRGFKFKFSSAGVFFCQYRCLEHFRCSVTIHAKDKQRCEILVFVCKNAVSSDLVLFGVSEINSSYFYYRVNCLVVLCIRRAAVFM